MTCRSGACPQVGLDETEFESATGGETETVRAEERVGGRHASGADPSDRSEEGIHRGVDRAGAEAAPTLGRY